MITVQLLNRMRSYLEGRKQSARLAAILASPQKVTCAIIQGSYLALTCFTLFIGELFQTFSIYSVIPLADDVKFVADLRLFSYKVVQKYLAIVYN